MIYYYQFEFFDLKIFWFIDHNQFYIKRIEFCLPSKRNRMNSCIPQNKQFLDCIHNYFDAYLYQKQMITPPPIRIEGTSFQKTIWKSLQKIPFGSTISYQKLAILSGYHPYYARAAGNACNRNPIPIIIPCHRVIGKNKQLIGFAGGLEIKQWLLEHEGH